ncbi:MAG: hypothetical protein QXR58_02920 [Candidatus Micrarchaeaceae archaeon]
MAREGSNSVKKHRVSSESKITGISSIALAIAIVAVIAIIAVIAYTKLSSTNAAQITAFKNSFISAPKVNIYVTAQNSSAFASTIGCATTLIEKIIETPQTHRNPNTIGFYVMNGTSCIYSANGLGSAIKNYTYASAQTCLNFSKGTPSIFLNYSTTNSTTAMHDALYVRGDFQFMEQCGIAYELT